MFISNAFAQTASGASTSGGLMSFLPIILMFVVLYFLMIRPQMKRQKEQRAMMEALAKGDEVVTTGGLLGKIVKVTDKFVVVEIAANTEVVLQKGAVSTVLPKGSIEGI